MDLLIIWGTILLSIITPSTAQGYCFGIDSSSLARRQDPSLPIVVSRLPLASNGSVPLRLEIREMKADKYKWDLFILALSMFQSASQDDPLSYYQISGIHGVPFVTWNGVEPVAGASQSGYCPHSSVLFPTWHRPYLALYEQQLYKLVNSIARMFSNSTERQLYQQAASNFRLPYWDWASPAPDGQTHFPDVFWSQSVTQYGPNGIQIIKNPLYSYEFHPLDSTAMIWLPLKNWNETKRAPDINMSELDPPSMNDQINAALLAKLPEIQQRLYILFSSYHEFNSFSNKGYATSQNLTNLDSIEAVHDLIHIYGGSRGHMTYVPLSSFDPLFLLHHTATDRLITMWQILNPTAWITPQISEETSYTSLKGSVQDSSTPLTPFMSSADGTFWDSDMSRSTETFGYAYADTTAVFADSKTVRANLIRKINGWLGNASPMRMRSKGTPQSSNSRQGSQVWTAGSDLKEIDPTSRVGAKNSQSAKTHRRRSYTEWIANVHLNRGALDGALRILFFNGMPPANTHDWEKAPNLIGSVGIFTMSGMGESRSKVSGTAPLTSALHRFLTAGYVPDLDPESVVPLLGKILEFRVLAVDEEEIDPELLSGLYIGISSTNVQVPESLAELPKWGKPTLRLHMWP